MKNLSRIILFTLASMVFCGACQDDETANVSFVTSYPILKVNGGEAIAVVKGTAFADPGVVATENGQEIPVEVSGNLDLATPGFYKLVYTATNSDGYSASVTRLVAVTAQDVSATDISGTYYRASNNRQSTVTKVSSGLYFMTDCWGTATSGGAPYPVSTWLLHTGGSSLILKYDESGAPFGGNTGSGVILTDRLSLTVTLVGAAATRTNQWLKL
jgi:hypothetical protein